MKKKFLLFAIIACLVIPGCGEDKNPLFEEGTSSPEAIATSSEVISVTVSPKETKESTENVTKSESVETDVSTASTESEALEFEDLGNDRDNLSAAMERTMASECVSMYFSKGGYGFSVRKKGIEFVMSFVLPKGRYDLYGKGNDERCVFYMSAQYDKDGKEMELKYSTVMNSADMTDLNVSSDSMFQQFGMDVEAVKENGSPYDDVLVTLTKGTFDNGIYKVTSVPMDNDGGPEVSMRVRVKGGYVTAIEISPADAGLGSSFGDANIAIQIPVSRDPFELKEINPMEYEELEPEDFLWMMVVGMISVME